MRCDPGPKFLSYPRTPMNPIIRITGCYWLGISNQNWQEKDPCSEARLLTIRRVCEGKERQGD